MSLTTRSTPIFMLLECNTEFVSVHERSEDDSKAVGDWLKRSLRDTADDCALRGVGRPHVQMVASWVTHHHLDKLTVEEFLQNDEIRRKSGET